MLLAVAGSRQANPAPRAFGSLKPGLKPQVCRIRPMILDVLHQLLVGIDFEACWKLFFTQRTGPMTLGDIVRFEDKRWFKGRRGERNRTGH